MVPADGGRPEIREIESFRPDALARESRIAVHHDGDDLFNVSRERST